MQLTNVRETPHYSPCCCAHRQSREKPSRGRRVLSSDVQRIWTSRSCRQSSLEHALSSNVEGVCEFRVVKVDLRMITYSFVAGVRVRKGGFVPAKDSVYEGDESLAA